MVLAGGTGFLGTRLQRALASAGYEVVVLTRHPEKVAAPARGVLWSPEKFGDWTKELDGAYGVINLAGKNVNCRRNAANRREILKSRVNSVRALAEAVRRCAVPPQVWVQAGSLGIHGDAGPLWCDETAPDGRGSAPEVCRKWEDAFFKAPMPPIRRVMLRIGFVLGNEGGTLPLLARLAKYFAGFPSGSGRQYVSWLHAHDMDRIFLHALKEPALSGICQACTAGPVTNAEFMAELRKVHHRPWMPAMPAWLVKAAAWLLGLDGSVALTGRRGLPGRLMETGFRFDYPALGPALDELLLGPRFPTPLSTAMAALPAQSA
ncbi:MAG: TIGR01777 family protein [Verrucomicrobiaceae bacterium]|nr:MAG: TIGR01777 family protein [Verrucomicrobiaceae bacterium]